MFIESWTQANRDHITGMTGITFQRIDKAPSSGIDDLPHYAVMDRVCDILAKAATLMAQSEVQPDWDPQHPHPSITPDNRHVVALCCVIGALDAAGWDETGLTPSRRNPYERWYGAALTALRYTIPPELDTQESFPKFPAVSNAIVARHGPAQATPILTVWLSRAAGYFNRPRFGAAC